MSKVAGNMKKRILGGGVAAVVGLAGVLAYAQAVPSGAAPPRLVPYVGHLDLDGSPVTGQVAMKVCLVTSPSTGCDAGTAWVDEFPSVDVAGGKFSLVLGQSKAIPDATFKATELYVRAMVGATVAQGTPTYVQLSGAQRVLSVPYAINLNHASDIRLDGPLHNGSALPKEGDLGIYNQTAGAPVRIATEQGPIRMSVAGEPAGNAARVDMLTVGTGGVQVGDNSNPIRQITTCRSWGSNFIPYPAGNKYIAFIQENCSRGLPVGTCFAVLGKTNDCGGGFSWTAFAPGQDARMPTGGVSWWNQADCSPTFHDVEATFFCSY